MKFFCLICQSFHGKVEGEKTNLSMKFQLKTPSRSLYIMILMRRNCGRLIKIRCIKARHMACYNWTIIKALAFQKVETMGHLIVLTTIEGHREFPHVLAIF